MELLYGNSIKSYPKGFNGEKWNTQRQNIKRKKDKPFSYLKDSIPSKDMQIARNIYKKFSNYPWYQSNENRNYQPYDAKFFDDLFSHLYKQKIGLKKKRKQNQQQLQIQKELQLKNFIDPISEQNSRNLLNQKSRKSISRPQSVQQNQSKQNFCNKSLRSSFYRKTSVNDASQIIQQVNFIDQAVKYASNKPEPKIDQSLLQTDLEYLQIFSSKDFKPKLQILNQLHKLEQEKQQKEQIKKQFQQTKNSQTDNMSPLLIKSENRHIQSNQRPNSQLTNYSLKLKRRESSNNQNLSPGQSQISQQQQSPERASMYSEKNVDSQQLQRKHIRSKTYTYYRNTAPNFYGKINKETQQQQQIQKSYDRSSQNRSKVKRPKEYNNISGIVRKRLKRKDSNNQEQNPSNITLTESQIQRVDKFINSKRPLTTGNMKKRQQNIESNKSKNDLNENQENINENSLDKGSQELEQDTKFQNYLKNKVRRINIQNQIFEQKVGYQPNNHNKLLKKHNIYIQDF